MTTSSHVNACAPGVPGQRLGLRSRPVAAGVLDEQRRKLGQVSEQGAHARVFEKVPGDDRTENTRCASGSNDMDAPAMQLEQHERGIHVV
jgi:hypothetical protein